MRDFLWGKAGNEKLHENVISSSCTHSYKSFWDYPFHEWLLFLHWIYIISNKLVK